MELIKNKKTIFAISISLAILSIFAFLAHRERIFVMFRESTSLNFQRDDMTYINITSRGIPPIDFNNVVIEDPEKIRETINFLNSLELVESRIPRNLTNSWQNRDFEDFGWISIIIGESPEHNPGDFVSFYANYMVFTYHGHRLFGIYTYYIRNSGFCSRTKTSNVYQFLYELIHRPYR